MHRPRHATVVAYLALFVALSGTAVAASGKIGSKQIKKGAVQSVHIKDRTIALKDLSGKARTALRGQRGATGPAGPAGAAGAPGAPGAPGERGPSGESAVPARTVVVGAGGTPEANGTALRAALAALPAATEAEPRAVQLGAGRYDLKGAGISVPSDVTLAGAGQDATIVESSPANVQLSVVSLGDRAGLRDLAVQTASAPLGSVAVDGTNGRDSLVERVELTGGVGAIQRGGRLRDARIVATQTGVRVLSGSSDTAFAMEDTAISLFGTGTARGVHASAPFTIDGSRVNASTANSTTDGVYYDATTSSRTRIRASRITASSGTTARGIIVFGTGFIEVESSSIDGSTTALSASTGDIRAAASQLDAPLTSSTAMGGQVKCVQVYNATYDAATCP